MDVGNVTVGVTFDRKEVAQDLRAAADLLDPEGVKFRYNMAYTDGFNAGDAGFKASIQKRDELQRKLNLEVAAHRENVALLHQATARLDQISRAFMDLHDLAKAVVGPKIKVLPEAEHPARKAKENDEQALFGIPARARLAADGED